jgi:hypothetical protein
MFNGVGAEESRSGFEDPVPKSTTTRRGPGMKLVPDQSQRAAEKGDPGRIGLHGNRDYACALRSGAMAG